MNATEAKQILRAYRDDSVDATDPAFTAALALVAEDAELRAWFERERKLNDALQVAHEEVPVPSALRERILAAQSRATVARPVWRHPALRWGLAAGLAAAVAIVALRWPRHQPASESALAEFALADAQHPKTHGGHGKEEAELKAKLKQSTTHLGVALLPDYHALHEGGCRIVQLEGRDVLEVCFKRNGTGLHYYIARREDFPALVAPETPVIVGKKAGNLVVWADGTNLFFVVTSMDAAQLQQLL